MTVGESSVVLAIRAGRILVVSRKDGSGFVLPGGKKESGETPKVTACREFYEEVESIVTPGRLVLLYRGPSSTGRIVSLYYAHKITNEPIAKEYGTQVGWFLFSSLLNSSPFAEFYKTALPDGVDHLRDTEVLVL